MGKVFKLIHDFDHLIDTDFDAVCDIFEGIDTIGFYMIGIDKFEMPNKIYLRANLNTIPYKTDYPIVDLTFPIISNRMIQTLEKVRPFKKRLLTTFMIDDTYLSSYLSSDNMIKDDVRFNSSYFGIQFTEYFDVFDYEMSIYKPLRSQPDLPGSIKKLILKEPRYGFPSIFKIKENLSLILVSEEGKNALETDRINGCKFEEVETS